MTAIPEHRPRRRIDFRRANALARLAKAGYPDALEALAAEMYGLVEALIAKRGWYLPGAEMEDLVQEGISNLPDTLSRWDETITDQFTSFASLAITRDLIQAIKWATRVKHGLHLGATSLNEPVRRGGDSKVDDDRLALWELPDTSGLGTNPAEVIDTGEGDGNWVLVIMRERLSVLEGTVLQRCLLQHEDYRLVASSLGIGVKSVDNAMQRVRRRGMQKLQLRIENGEFDEDTVARIERLKRRRIGRTAVMAG